MAPTAIDAYRQKITAWSERLRFHLLQFKATSGFNTSESTTTQQVIAEVVQALGQMQSEVMAEVQALNQRYQQDIDEAPFWRRAFLQRKQVAEEAAYREITLLIEQVLLAAANIRQTISVVPASTPAQTASAPVEPPTAEAESEVDTAPDAQPEIRAEAETHSQDASTFPDSLILQQELRRIADQWKWRLDSTRTMLESGNLSPERIAYIRGIQTTAWNILQDITALLDDDSLTS